MRAVIFDKIGGPEVLHVANIPKPSPGPGQALVKMEWAGVNFIDTYHRTGLYPIKLPFTSGRDGAGVVESLSSDVSPDIGIKVGDRVAIYDSSTVAEYVATRASRLLKLPDNVDTRAGAALMAQGLTAWTLVRDAHDVKPGETVLVHAAAGGTGGLVVQMAKHLGAIVIGTASTPEKIEIAKQHGCDHVINYSEKNTLEEVMKLTDGKGCHAVFSGIGQATFKDDLECVRRKGTMVTFGNASGAVEGFRPLELGKKNVKLVRPRLDAYIVDQEEFDQRSQELVQLISKGVVKLTYGKEYSMEEVGQAHIDLTSRKTTGKLLIKIS